MIQFYVSVFAAQVGASASMAFYTASILNAGAFFGCYALGLVADSGLGFFNCLSATTFACSITGLTWIAVKTYGSGIIAWSIVYGLLSGAVQAIYSPCLSLLAPTPEIIGRWNGKYQYRCSVLPLLSEAVSALLTAIGKRNMHNRPVPVSSGHGARGRTAFDRRRRHQLLGHATIHWNDSARC